MQPDPKVNSVENGATRSANVVRSIIAIGLLLAVAAYIAAIVGGRLPDDRRLGPADVGVMLVTAMVAVLLFHPEFLQRLSHFKFGNVEFELRKLQEDQKVQRDELDDLRFVLTLLLQEPEREHLRNLEAGKTQEYVGSHALRTELRKLRTLGLIQDCKGRHISELVDNAKMDLSKIVELTERGQQYLERLGEFDAAGPR